MKKDKLIMYERTYAGYLLLILEKINNINEKIDLQNQK